MWGIRPYLMMTVEKPVCRFNGLRKGRANSDTAVLLRRISKPDTLRKARPAPPESQVHQHGPIRVC